MRNLQKILALALALIMSFSLVVTANAAFSDEADINETYAESVTVLSGLEVFRGYTDGSYKPQDSITRAEVAAIIYRIATGDVNDTQVSIYSDWNRFSDVQSGSWYAGYVNYCANAEYIQGYGDGRFGPNDPVTGYQALAMILRAVGYGKMDEFTGSNWAVQTAARANTLKVSRNVTAALLGSAASREVVAELLFRSILVSTVDYNQFTGYTETGTTLGANLGLEEVEGVVVANERANLYGEDVLAAGKTDLEVAEGDIRSLDYVSDLTDIGESRYAYIVGSKVLALADTGKNVTKETGAETDISTDKKFKDFSGLTNTDDTEYYVDFGREGYYTSDYRLEFNIEFDTLGAKKDFEKEYETGDIAKQMDVDDGTKTATDTDGTTVYLSFTRVIRAEKDITQEQLNIIHGIFAMADDSDKSDGVMGEVFAGTLSTDNSTDRYDDLSDEISYRTFVKEYINSEDFSINWNDSENGEWVKVIDNDSDGNADYAFKTHYYLDKVIGSYTKSGEDVLEYYYLDLDDYDVIYDAEVAVDDIVLYTLIDNQAIVELPEKVSDQIKAISFKDVTVTTDSDNTYGQSGIFNKTKMDEVITNMDEDVDYNMYLDKYGYIRAYELAAGTKYALLTELYYGYYQNGRYVTNNDLTVELTAGEEKTAEFDVLNEDGNDFVMANVENQDENNWGTLSESIYQDVYASLPSYNVGADRNVLQPATAHLAYPDNTILIGYEDGSEYFAPAVTNVAKYVQTDDGVRITSAAQQAKTTKGEIIYYTNATFSMGTLVDRGTTKLSRTEWVEAQFKLDNTKTRDQYGNDFDTNVADGTFIPVYAEDYIELKAGQALEKKERKYLVDDSVSGANNEYVNAVHDTEYYIVSTDNNGKITYFVDYTNVPKFDKDQITAIYAVAHNTEADSQKADYWVADVIVIQVDNWTSDHDSISLAFYNPYEESTRVRNLDTLNNKHKGVAATVIPSKEGWGTEWKNYGFYKLYDTTTDNDTITADDIKIIGGARGTANPEEYSENKIYAGTIVRREDVNENGGYLVVDRFGGEGRINIVDGTPTVDATATDITNVDVAPVYGIDGTELDSLRLRDGANSEVVEGDEIIWVMNGDDVAFIVDVTDLYEDGTEKDYDTPAWLKNIYNAMREYQRRNEVAGEDEISYTITVGGTGAANIKEITGGAEWTETTTPGKYTLTATETELTITPKLGYKLISVDVAAADAGNAVLRAMADGTYLLSSVKDDVTLEIVANVQDTSVTVTKNTGVESITATYTDRNGDEQTITGTATDPNVPTGAVLTVAATLAEGYEWADGDPDGTTVTTAGKDSVTIAPTAQKITYKVLLGGTEESTVEHGDMIETVNSVTITAATGENLPATVTITMGDLTLIAGVHYTYTQATGAIEFDGGTASSILPVTDDIEIEYTPVMKTYDLTVTIEAGKNTTVTVAGATGTNADTDANKAHTAATTTVANALTHGDELTVSIDAGDANTFTITGGTFTMNPRTGMYEATITVGEAITITTSEV